MTMQLYFLRHGVAGKRSEWQGDDRERPLTEDGREAIVREGVALMKHGVEVDLIVTSPLARARQTAEIVAEELGAGERIVDDERLAHGFTRKQLVRILAEHPEAGSVMLVGHEPEFSAVIGELTGGRVVCKKGCLARVDVGDRTTLRGELVWLLQPKTLTL
jgi:phosphohistidine phosphatase